MPRFPFDENSIIALARVIAGGIKANPTRFSAPPVTAVALDAEITAYDAKVDEITDHDAVGKGLYQDKSEILERIIEGAKENLAYAELIAKGDNAILAEVGWGTRAAPTKLQPPGVPRSLEIVNQGDGWAEFDWKEPLKTDGGKPASYAVERSEDGGKTWTDAKASAVSEATAVNQPRGKFLLYRVVSINRAGRSEAGNTVSITF